MVKVCRKISGNYRQFPQYFLSPPTYHLPNISSLHQAGTGDETTLTHYYHPKFLVCFGFALCAVHSMSFDKYVRMCIHHYNLAQNSFLALKISSLYLLSPPLPQTLNNHPLLTASIDGLFQNAICWNHTACRLFKLTFSNYPYSFNVSPQLPKWCQW